MKRLAELKKIDFSCLKKDMMLFYAAFYLMVFAKAFGLYSADKSYYILFAVSACLLAVRLLLIRKTIADYCKIGLLMFPGVLIFLHNRETTLLFTCLFIVSAKDIHFETAMKGACGIYLTAVPIRILLYFLGIVEGGSKAIMLPDGTGGSYLSGYTYGYGYVTPNMLFAAVFIGVLLLFYVKRNSLNTKMLCGATAVLVLTFAVTKCKTGIIVYAAVLAAALPVVFRKSRRIDRSICILMVLISVGIGIVFPLIYTRDNYIMYYFNKWIISGRALLAQNALLENGISLLGKGGVFVDILYMDVLLNDGIVGFLLLLAGMAFLCFTFDNAQNRMGLICAAAMILYACMEQFPLNIAMNPFLLYLGTDVLFKPKRTGKENIL